MMKDSEWRLTRLRREADAAAGLCGPRTAKIMSRAADWLPEAVAEAEAARSLLRRLEAEYARLAGAARASVTAAAAGESDPLAYVRAELARHGGLPANGVTVPQVLADAAGAMRVTARAGRLPGRPGKAAVAS